MTYVRPHIYIDKYPRFSIWHHCIVSRASLARQLKGTPAWYLLIYLFVYLFIYLFIIIIIIFFFLLLIGATFISAAA